MPRAASAAASGTSSTTTCSCRSSAPPRRRAQALTRCRWVSPASWRRWARSSPLWARSSCCSASSGSGSRSPHRRYHAIVAGDGPVALKLAGSLHAEKRKLVLFSPKVVLVSSDDDTLTRGRQAKLLGYRGDPSDPVTLRAAGVTRAAELYACTRLWHRERGHRAARPRRGSRGQGSSRCAATRRCATRSLASRCAPAASGSAGTRGCGWTSSPSRTSRPAGCSTSIRSRRPATVRCRW